MGLTKEEAEFLKQQEEEMKSLQTSNQVSQMNQAQQSMMMQDQERSMIKEQLDLGEELEMIENLLKGNVYDKEQGWLPPQDNEMVVLSDYGIHLIMNTITFYINKNTLLSNYDEDTINQKMEDFASDLADTIFMEYEKVFQYPTYDDCKKVLLDRLERKKKEAMDESKFSNKKFTEEEIEFKLSKELDGKFNSEVVKIKEQIIKNKLKRFMILLRTVQDAVHSTYLRAWKGQERRTLREHIHISESRGGNQFSSNQPTKMNPMNWIRGR